MGCNNVLTPHMIQGAMSSEVQAVSAVREAARGGVAYLNLESGDCHGDGAAVNALVGARVSRVVVGLENPLPHARGVAVRALRNAGIQVGEKCVCDCDCVYVCVCVRVCVCLCAHVPAFQMCSLPACSLCCVQMCSAAVPPAQLSQRMWTAR